MVLRLTAALVAAATMLSAPEARAQSFINVLTGGTSGVYYPLGVALGKIFGEKMPEREDVGAGHQGVGRESQSCCSRAAARSPSRSATR